MVRKSDLKFELTVQAYPEQYYADLETSEAANIYRPGADFSANPGRPNFFGVPYSIGLNNLGQGEDFITFEVG